MTNHLSFSVSLLTLMTSVSAAAADDVPLISRDDITVTAQLSEAPVAAKADIAPLENSQAISVISQELMEGQGVRRIADALLNVAGVSRSNNYGFFDGFNIRGFNASTGATYLDGLLDDTGYGTSEMTALERVEVVKGPASGLFGQGPISGMVNLVSKRPQQEAFLDVGISGGSYDFKEITLDANGPLNASGTLLGRLPVVYRDQDFFVHYSGQRRIFLAPSLTWKPDDRTALTLLGRYVDDHINPWSPTTAYGTALPNPNARSAAGCRSTMANIQRFRITTIGMSAMCSIISSARISPSTSRCVIRISTIAGTIGCSLPECRPIVER